MTQKFNKDPKIRADRCIEKIVFDLQQNQIFVTYHRPEGCINAKEKTFRRDRTQGIMISSQQKEGLNTMEDRAENDRVNSLERDCLNSIKYAEAHAKEEIKSRQEEEESILPLLNMQNIKDALSKAERAVLKKNI